LGLDVLFGIGLSFVLFPVGLLPEGLVAWAYRMGGDIMYVTDFQYLCALTGMLSAGFAMGLFMARE
jgi:hypothetical protein